MSIDSTILTSLAIVSVIMFIGSLILIPIIITRLPKDYFAKTKQNKIATKNTVMFLVKLLKNILGVIFIIAGIAMLVLPGQGILTILIGLGLTDFPGKYKLERKIIKNKRVFNSLNWIRKKAGVKSFLYPESH